MNPFLNISQARCPVCSEIYVAGQDGRCANCAGATLEPPTPAVEQAREDRLREGLTSLAAWANARAHGVHNVETTLTMLHRKVTDLRAAVAKAGQRAAAPANLEECIVVHFRGDPTMCDRLTFQQFHALKNSGMLWELYPDAPAVWPKANRPSVDATENQTT